MMSGFIFGVLYLYGSIKVWPWLDRRYHHCVTFYINESRLPRDVLMLFWPITMLVAIHRWAKRYGVPQP